MKAKKITDMKSWWAEKRSRKMVPREMVPWKKNPRKNGPRKKDYTMCFTEQVQFNLNNEFHNCERNELGQ